MSRERAVAVVEVEDVRAVVAEEDVRVAVVVDVADDDPVAEAREAQARRLGHVLELAVAQVLVEPVRALPGGPEGQERAGGEVEVELAVVVVVEDGHARAVGGGEVLLLGHAREVDEVDPGLAGDLGEPERARLGLLGLGRRQVDGIGQAVALDLRGGFARRAKGRGARTGAAAGTTPVPTEGGGAESCPQPARQMPIPIITPTKASAGPPCVSRLMHRSLIGTGRAPDP